jgi:SSS family solute:Na+ symporter
MGMDHGAALGAFVAYLLAVIGIGAWASRRASEGIDEFFVGGRRMNRFVVALSAVVSGRSAWLLLGFTGMAYTLGAQALWAAVGYIGVELFLFLSYGRRLRRFAGARDCITITDFFAERLGDERGALRVLLSVVILVFMVSYVSAQFVAGGKALAGSFPVGHETGVLLTAAIVLVYTLAGGFLAVSFTDLLQALLMLVALVLLPVLVIAHEGGLGLVWSELAALDPKLVDPMALSLGVFVGFLGIGLGSPGNPHILARYISIEDAEQLKTAAWVGTLWNVLMAAGALFIGLAGRAIVPELGDLPGADAEQVYPLLAQTHLPPALFGLVVAAVFAAIMSTADSQLLVAASAVVRDVHQKVLRRHEDLDERDLVRQSRVVVLALVAIALALGFVGKVVFWLVLFAWAGLGAALGPTSILALYWRRTTLPGVFAGVIAGTAVTIVWKSVPALKGALYELVPAFVAALLVTVLVSILTRPPPGVDRMFEEMRRPGA